MQNFAMFVDLQKGLDPYAYVKELIDWEIQVHLDNSKSMSSCAPQTDTIILNFQAALCSSRPPQLLEARRFLFVEHMEELGIIVDVSHLSDAGFWDIARHAKKPFVASHSNARALCRHRR